MSTPVEFSKFFQLLHEVKEGKEEKSNFLAEEMNAYRDGNLADSFLHELGQFYLYVGIIELYNYTKSQSIESIGSLDKEEWIKLEIENEEKLHQYLARNMVEYSDANKKFQQIAEKWNKSKREIQSHSIKMSRYITEGIIDVLE